MWRDRLGIVPSFPFKPRKKRRNLPKETRPPLLAEGSTGEGFETWVLVQNPGDTAVTADLDFMTSTGEQAGPHDVAIPAGTRVTLRLNDYVTDYNVSTGITTYLYGTYIFHMTLKCAIIVL